MGKIPTKNCLMYLGGYDLTLTMLKWQPTKGFTVADATSLGDASDRVLATTQKNTWSHAGFYDDAAGLSEAALTALINTLPVASLLLGSAAAAPAANNVCFSGTVLELAQLGDPIPLKGLVGLAAELAVDNNLDIGNLIQPVVTKGTNFNGAGVDNGAGTSNGGMMYVHVFASNGTATIKIQDSADNITFADLAGASYSVPSGASSGTGLVAAGATVRQYLRATLTLGTATSVQYAVIFGRR